MGLNYSRASQSRTPIATITPSPPTFGVPYDNYKGYGNNNYRYALPESRAPPPPPPRPSVAVVPPPKALNTNQIIAFHSDASWKAYFEASKASNKLIVIDFTATWCGPCRSMEPALNEFAAKYNDVDFVKIDVDELFNVSCEYGVQVMPTFLFIKKGKQVDKVVGAKKEELQRKIEKHRLS